MKQLLFPLAMMVLIGLVASGCSSTNNPSELNTKADDFGPYLATDEEPYFGDAAVEQIVTTGETEYEDPVALSAVVDSVENLAVPDIFCFRMVWGNLEHDSGITELTNWSGKLTISRGAIVVTRLIWFEPGQDYLLPRYNDDGFYVPEELAWVSKTSVHIDGIATKLFIPPSVNEEVVTVEYESEQLTISFTMDQLETLDTMIAIGPGNAIAFHSTRFDPTHRLRGFLAGTWGRDDDGNGIFIGKWMSSNGRMLGSVMGKWGHDDDGRPVFVGKWIDQSGKFEGFLKGYWRVRGIGDNAVGRFWGRIFNADREPIGLLHGHFKKGETRRGGFFAGRWCVGCRIPAVISPYAPFDRE